MLEQRKAELSVSYERLLQHIAATRRQVISIVGVRIISIVIIIIILLRIVHQWLELENDTRAQLSLGLADRTHGAPPKIRRKIIRLAENPLVS